MIGSRPVTLPPAARTRRAPSAGATPARSWTMWVARCAAPALAAGGSVTGRLPIIDGLAVRLSARGARSLAHDPRVKAVSVNAAVRRTAAGVDTRRLATAYQLSVQAPQAWHGATGRGVGVAVIDTGIAGDLPDFRGDDGRSRVIASAVVNQDATTASDSYGHGTDVAGIIAGDGTRRDASDPQRGRYVGIAPGANLISVKVADESGRATVLDVIYGLQFAVDHKDDYGIRVVNLSLQSTSAESYKTDPLDAAAESAYFHGLLVVAAAGNRGAAPDAVSYAPGNDPFVLTVGAVDDQGTRRTGDDRLADWSSRGVTQDGFAKPEIAAPGAHIVSTLAPGSAFPKLCPSCVLPGGYFRAGGTSMAAPVVAGVAALVLERHPDWTVGELKATLIGDARDLSAPVREVNAQAAVSRHTPLVARDAGIEPNRLVNPATGAIDYSLSSWSLSSWSAAPGPLAAGFALSSWSCACGRGGDGGVDPTLSSWSLSSWSTRWDL